ncbi:hypothetical protein HQ602_09415 [Rhodococcus kroppenstedtii]|nr:hypothetical protein [Rhodococcus kroppenstedtii]
MRNIVVCPPDPGPGGAQTHPTVGRPSIVGETGAARARSVVESTTSSGRSGKSSAAAPVVR